MSDGTGELRTVIGYLRLLSADVADLRREIVGGGAGALRCPACARDEALRRESPCQEHLAGMLGEAPR